MSGQDFIRSDNGLSANSGNRRPTGRPEIETEKHRASMWTSSRQTALSAPVCADDRKRQSYRFSEEKPDVRPTCAYCVPL